MPGRCGAPKTLLWLSHELSGALDATEEVRGTELVEGTCSSALASCLPLMWARARHVCRAASGSGMQAAEARKQSGRTVLGLTLGRAPPSVGTRPEKGSMEDTAAGCGVLAWSPLGSGCGGCPYGPCMSARVSDCQGHATRCLWLHKRCCGRVLSSGCSSSSG